MSRITFTSRFMNGLSHNMENFKKENLGLARKLRGLSKTELAELIEKTPGAISQFESGKYNPDKSTLNSLALALGFPVDFFFKDLQNVFVNVDDCHFRSLRSATQKSRNRVISNGIILNNIVSLLEEHVELPQERVSLVTQSVDSLDDIERLAIEVRQKWGYGIGPIPNLIQMLEAKGIIVSYIPADSAEVDAFSTWQFSRPYIFLLMHESSSRIRFSCAHELGHLVMHTDAKPGDKILENQANRFAGAFLFPRDAFLREYPNRLDWNVIYSLKQRWKMSAAAIVRRAYDLDCISERTYRRAYMHMAQMGHRKAEPFEFSKEKVSLLSRSMDIVLESNSFEDISNELCLRPQDLALTLENINCYS